MSESGQTEPSGAAFTDRTVDHAQQRVSGRVVQAARLASLLDRSARNQVDAFTELYDETCDRIYGLVVRVIRSPELAQEVTRDVYVEIWRRAARYSADGGTVLAWMTSIAHSRAVERVRTASSEEHRHHRVHTDAERDVDRVWAGVEPKIDITRVRRGWETLTETQREALSLAYFGGYTHDQVAKLLELPLGTAKTRIRDGLIGLRDALGVQT